MSTVQGNSTSKGSPKPPLRWRRTCALLALCAALFTPAAALAETVSSVVITGLSTLADQSVRDVITIEAGDEYAPAAVDAAVKRLTRWGVFDAVHTETVRGASGMEIRFAVHEATIVSSVDVSGNYPYVQNKVRRYLTLHPGDPFSREIIDAQVARIKEFYAREGFVGTEVDVAEEPHPSEQGVDLTFHIRRGQVLRYRSIEVRGNSAFPQGRFVTAINPYRSFSEQRLRRSLRELREFYQSEGYPKIHISVADKRIDEEAKRIDLVLDVSEGSKVAVSFEGESRVSRHSLRKALTLFSDGSIDAFELDDNAEELRKLLVDRGYPDAKVGWQRKEKEDGTILIVFAIDAGTSRRIAHLSFDGTRGVSSKDLKEGMHNRQKAFRVSGAYDPEAQKEDDAAILTAMRHKGYVDAGVGSWEISQLPEGGDLSIAIPVAQGPQTIVGAIEFPGNDAFSTKRLLEALKMKIGKPLDEPGLEEDRKRLLAFYADRGYPYAEISQSWHRDASNSNAIIRYEISQGAFTRFGSILIVGDVLTSQKAIRHAMEFKEGDPYSAKKLIESQLGIRRLGPFSYVNLELIGLDERSNIVHVKVKVEEERPFLIDLGLTYSTADRLVGTLAFTNINSFGWAKRNALKLTAGQHLSRAELSWLDPRFLGADIEMSTAGWIQYKKQPTYAYTQMGGGFGWAKRFARFGFFTRYELDRNYFVQGDSTAADADSLRDNTISRISLSANYDTRDSFSNPSKGFYTLAGVDIYNEIKGNEANFVKFTWQGEYDQGFLRRLVLSTALRADRIQAIGSDVSVPTSELLFLGGDFTVRGFAEDSLGPVDANGNATGGRTRFIINEELRVRLTRSFSVAAFFDMGTLTNTFSEIGWESFRKSAGLGLRYITPVGPIRLDYGFKLDRKDGESIGRLHFTFGYVF
jgi:outer membrane protein insertion porin family